MNDNKKTPSLCEALCADVTDIDPCSEKACDSEFGKFLYDLERLDSLKDKIHEIAELPLTERRKLLIEVGHLSGEKNKTMALVKSSAVLVAACLDKDAA